MKKSLLANLVVAALVGYSSFAWAEPQANSATAHEEHQHGGHEKGSPRVGKAGDPNKVNRTVTVDMRDTMRFSPEPISVKRGEVIRFVVKNSGKLKHEMVIGPASELQEHAKMMQKFSEMEHSEPNQVTLQSGEPAPSSGNSIRPEKSTSPVCSLVTLSRV